jgi:hypothetical protein
MAAEGMPWEALSSLPFDLAPLPVLLSRPVCQLKSNAFTGSEPQTVTQRDPSVTGICFRAIPAPQVQGEARQAYKVEWGNQCSGDRPGRADPASIPSPSSCQIL